MLVGETYELWIGVFAIAAKAKASLLEPLDIDTKSNLAG